MIEDDSIVDVLSIFQHRDGIDSGGRVIVSSLMSKKEITPASRPLFFIYEMRTIVNKVVCKEELKRELLEILFLPVNYKNGQRSGFHNHSQAYRDFLNKRKEHAEKIQEIKKRYDIL